VGSAQAKAARKRLQADGKPVGGRAPALSDEVTAMMRADYDADIPAWEIARQYGLSSPGSVYRILHRADPDLKPRSARG
jgi:hypothetical protein